MLKSNNVEFTRAYMEFSDAIMKNLVADSEDNVFVSPMSIIIALAMLLECTEGETKQEILDVINVQDADGFINALKLAVDMASSDGAFQSANAIISKLSFAGDIKSSCIEVLKKDFDMEFFAEKNAANRINSWVNEKTLGMIRKIMDDGNLFDFAIINAVAFIGKWLKKYEPSDIEKGFEFTNNRGQTEEVTVMCSKEDSYIEGDECEGFVKPYTCGYDFMAVLPKDPHENLEQLVDRGLVGRLSRLYETRKSCLVKVDLPEFESSFDCSLTGVLKSIGVKSAFTEFADMSPLTDFVGTHIEEVQHKTYVKVDAEGTKAAAVTMITVVAGGVCDFDYKYVSLNRPFVFAIMHRETGLPVFVGRMNRIVG